jgi:hypothetical protein
MSATLGAVLTITALGLLEVTDMVLTLCDLDVLVLEERETVHRAGRVLSQSWLELRVA